MDFTSINNFRELGGIVNKEGKKVKNHVLLRSADLNKLSKEDEKRLLNEYNLKTIIDFRTVDEKRKGPDIVPKGVKYIDVTPLEDFNDEITRTRQKIESYNQLFIMIYEHLARDKSSVDSYKTFFKELKELPEGGSILWHCTQGKDRTGIASYLLLTLLDVDEETIIKEYLLTNDVYKPQVEMMIKKDGEEKRKDIEDFMLVSLDNLHRYVNIIKEKYHSIDQFFADGLELSKKDIEDIKKKFLE